MLYKNMQEQDGHTEQDGTPLCIGIFGYVDGKNGLATGRRIKRSQDDPTACDADDNTDECITDITRRLSDFDISLDSNDDGVDDLKDEACGCGCTWRDTYPPYFSRLVLAHELGHYFGLTHAGHDGVHNIMFSKDENQYLGGGSWRLWMHGDPNFVEEDVEHAWRFIVKKMPHVLRAL